MRAHWCLLGSLLALQACSVDVSSRNSDEVSNLNVRAELSALSSGDEGSVELSAVLLDDSASPVYVRLNGDDELLGSNGLPTDQAFDLDGNLFGGTAELSDAVLRLQERFRVDWDLLFVEVTSEPSYSGIFLNPDRSKPFYISFLRKIDNSIHNAEIAFPPGFEISAPASGSSVSRGAPIQVAWAPGGFGYQMQLQAAASCVSASGVERYRSTKLIAGDPGVAEVTTAEIFGDAVPDGECSVAVALKRIRFGTVPAAFGGGGMTMGIERRVVSFQLGS